MRRVWKRMTGMLLAAVLLVSMGMTVSAKGVSYSELSKEAQIWANAVAANDTPLEKALSILKVYLETGEWDKEYDAVQLSVEDARMLYAYLNGDGSEEKNESTKTAADKVQDKAVQEIDRALQTGSTTAVFDGKVYGINTLSRDLMGEVNRRGVSMVFKYTYNGYYYEITIPAGQAPVDPNVQWCGPMYLYSLFADTAVVTPVA